MCKRIILMHKNKNTRMKIMHVQNILSTWKRGTVALGEVGKSC